MLTPKPYYVRMSATTCIFCVGNNLSKLIWFKQLYANHVARAKVGLLLVSARVSGAYRGRQARRHQARQLRPPGSLPATY